MNTRLGGSTRQTRGAWNRFITSRVFTRATNVLGVLALVAAVASVVFDIHPPVRTTSVAAIREWHSSGIQIRRGQEFNISATGKWSNVAAPETQWIGPQGHAGGFPGTVLPDAPIGALIGRVVGCKAFRIGKGNNAAFPCSGELLLAMNDVPGMYADNAGFLNITVRRGPTLTTCTISLCVLTLGVFALILLRPRSKELVQAPQPETRTAESILVEQASLRMIEHVEKTLGPFTDTMRLEMADMVADMPVEFVTAVANGDIEPRIAYDVMLTALFKDNR